MREIVDTCGDGRIEKVVVQKPVQSAGSTGVIQTVLGWLIDEKGGDILYVLPNEQSAREQMGERFVAYVKDTPALKRRLSPAAKDTTKFEVKFDRGNVYIGWMGSAQSMASRPLGWVIIDEANKGPAYLPGEGDPIALASKRSTTFRGARLTLIVSTPTTTNGHITKQSHSCGDQRQFWMPCPHCDAYRYWEFKHLTGWGKPEDGEAPETFAERIKRDQLAHLKCPDCDGMIHEADKAAIARRGRWVSRGQTVDADGNVVGARPFSSSVSFTYNVAPSPWVSFAEWAAEFIIAKRNAADLTVWRNNYCTEVSDVAATAIKTTYLEAKLKTEDQPAIVPRWAGGLVIGADTQKDHFYATVVAFGAQYRQRVIWADTPASFDELEALLYREWQVDGGGIMVPSRILIDSGGTHVEGQDLTRSQQVKLWTVQDEPRRKAVVGRDHDTAKNSKPIWPSRQNPAKSDNGVTMPPVTLTMVQVQHFKRLAVERLLAAKGEPGHVEFYQGAPEWLSKHLTNIQWSYDPKTGKGKWTTRHSGPDHGLDAFVYAQAAMDGDVIIAASSEDQIVAQHDRIAGARPQSSTNTPRQPNPSNTQTMTIQERMRSSRGSAGGGGVPIRGRY